MDNTNEKKDPVSAEEEAASEKKIVIADDILPHKLFILPLKMRPIFPGLIAPVLVIEEPLKQMVDDILERDHMIGFIFLKNDVEEMRSITREDLNNVGTVAKIFKKVELPEGHYNVLVNTMKRFTVKKIISFEPYITAAVEYFDEEENDDNDIELRALTQAMLADIKFVIENNPLMTQEMKLNLMNINEEPGKMADIIVSILNIPPAEQQKILETFDIKKRLERLLILLNKEKEMLKMQNKIRKEIEEKVANRQREYFLREQLKMIKDELGMEKDEKTQDVEEFRTRYEKISSALSEEVSEKIEKELEKLNLLEPVSAEYGVVRNYLDTLLSLPWAEKSTDNIEIARARKILDNDHYGLQDVKDRILEFLAVKKIKPDSRGSIILFVGPPGVGKTSVGRSLARSMNREFFRFSLGGMRDESEIKGHRRTYVGAMPGKIMQAMSIVKTKNPVIMLDEIDKLGISFQGDPSAALLEVLDPEQNYAFRDHYLDVPFDLSEVLFISTANTLDTIPRPLLDRMETIRLSGYIDEEKTEIGKRYLVPKSMEKHGINKKSVKFPKKSITEICKKYARQAGVRDLEKLIDKIMRKVALKYAESGEALTMTITPKCVEKFLGQPYFTKEEWQRITKPGMVRGLAWTALGGTTLVIEAVAVEGKRGLKLTGQLGEVMTESANIAYSFISANKETFGISKEALDHTAVHLHVPEGATPKDGPSAGITMAVALYSLFKKEKIANDLAMTGELSLTGNVLPVGGIREKVVAAKRNGVKEIILPEANKNDYDKIPAKIKKGLNIHFVRKMSEVIRIITE
ncbi:MAG TPA: endopeptidase La [Firmicutes bacterium]|nr:endopeptidase La [Bacillota bacterium]